VRDINYDEAAVPDFRLPDPLRFADGSPVATAEDWWQLRRPELLDLFAATVYGRGPDLGRAEVSVQDHRSWGDAVGGTAIQEEIRLRVEGVATPIDVLLVLPRRDQPVPVWCSLNFYGNASVTSDPRIRLHQRWTPGNRPGIEGNRLTEAARGCDAQRWPLPLLIERGYGFATFHTSDVSPDSPQLFRTVMPELFSGVDGLPCARDPHQWGSIGAWAWGLSRLLDHLVTDPRVDVARIGVVGHSRLGKTALWAGAQDQRFSVVASNESGCAGAALSRRRFGQTVADITAKFGYWFCENLARYADREDALPIDQHELLALIAPRLLHVGSAAEDLWADPRGEFLSAVHADPVYRLLGVDGIATNEMPEVGQTVTGRIGYHIRPGVHELTDSDWSRYLDTSDVAANVATSQRLVELGTPR